MSRLDNCFSQLKEEARKGLITFTMAYDPNYEKSLETLLALPEAGADIIELGMPFSDPMADGPVIQEAGVRALKQHAKMAGVLDMVRHFRKTNTTTPIILMGYYNPIQHYGIASFTQDAANAGVDGLIIVDLPPEEDQELLNECDQHTIALIKLITPTTNEARLPTILAKARGFIYYVSITGITGTAAGDYKAIEAHVKQIKQHTNLPIAVGFGIKTPHDVEQAKHVADAVVVGSSIVKLLGQEAPTSDITDFVKSLAGALT